LSALSTFPSVAYLAYKTAVNKAIDSIKPGDTFNDDIFKTYSDNFSGIISNMLSGDKYAAKYSELLLNVNRFAAYKAYHATQQIARQWADADGVLRDVKQYKEAAKRVANKFNRYQVAEYNTATARARTAKQWIDFTSDEIRVELYPNLKWLPSRSAERRPEHIEFYDIIRPKTDSFWNDNQPGNLWNCKCDWEETDEGTTDKPKRAASAQQGLEGNPGETGEIFTKEQVYFKAAPAEAQIPISQAYYPDHIGKFRINALADKSEIVDNVATGRILIAHESNMQLVINPHISGKSNPEFTINGSIADAKRIKGYKGITSGFVKAKEQGCDAVIIDFNKHFDPSRPLNVNKITGRLLWRINDFTTEEIKSCYLIFGSRVAVIKRDDMIKNKIVEIIKGLNP